MSFFTRKNKKNKSKKEKKEKTITRDFIQDDTLLQDMSIDITDDFGVLGDFGTEKTIEEMPKVIEEQNTPTDSLIEESDGEKIPLELLFAKKDLESLKEEEEVKIVVKQVPVKPKAVVKAISKEHYFQTHVKQSVKITHAGDKQLREKITFSSNAGEVMFYVLIHFDHQYKVTTFQSFEIVAGKPVMRNKAVTKIMNLRLVFDLGKISPILVIGATHQVDLKIKNKNAKKLSWTLDNTQVL